MTMKTIVKTPEGYVWRDAEEASRPIPGKALNKKCHKCGKLDDGATTFHWAGTKGFVCAGCAKS